MKKSYILVNEADRVFTKLNYYDAKKKSFEGEYSLTQGTYTNDNYFLSKFLVANEKKPLIFLGSSNTQYFNTIQSYEHFGFNDIPKYVEEKLEVEKQNHLFMEKIKKENRRQFEIFRTLISKEMEETIVAESKKNADHDFLAGKKLAFKTVLRYLDEFFS